MFIMPRPLPPYWPGYPEPERSRLEAEYRCVEARWQRETGIQMMLHLGIVLTGFVGLLIAAVWLALNAASIVGFIAGLS